MEKLVRSLRERLAAAGPEAGFRLIVTLAETADWSEGVRRLQEAGLAVDAGEEALRMVFGRAHATDVDRIAALAAVRLVELDEEVKAL